MAVEDKYLNEDEWNSNPMFDQMARERQRQKKAGLEQPPKGYKLTHPEICQSCRYSTKGKRGFGQLECKVSDINVEVDNYGTCPKWTKVYG
jgi:hypothetical protein